MADDNKSGTNLASSGAVVAALAAKGLCDFHQEAPLVDLRPTAEATATGKEYAAPQTVEARLWQDSYAAVDKSRDKSGELDSEQKCQDRSGLEVPPCKVPLGKNDKDTLVLCVTVPGAPYPEDVERRRRTRYAVLAGLEHAGFVPEDRRQLGYFIWTQLPLPVEVARPWATGPARNLNILVRAEVPLFALLQPGKEANVQRRIQYNALDTMLARDRPHNDYFVWTNSPGSAVSSPVQSMDIPVMGQDVPPVTQLQPVPDSTLTETTTVPYERFKKVPNSAVDEKAQGFGIATISEGCTARQILPLINSRISSAVLAWPSAISPTAEQICPGVQ